MKKIFVDTNILISGIFFRGNEAKLLEMPGIELITSDTVIAELKKVTLKKFTSLSVESRKIVMEEIHRATMDLRIIGEKEYLQLIPRASQLVAGEADGKILAAVIRSKPDYFVTGDKHFHVERVREIAVVKSTIAILRELEIL